MLSRRRAVDLAPVISPLLGGSLSSYDEIGNVTEIDEVPNGVRRFNYDLLDRVTAGGLELGG